MPGIRARIKAPLPARLERAGRGRGVWQAQKRLHPAGGRAAGYGRKRRGALLRANTQSRARVVAFRPSALHLNMEPLF